MRMHCLLQLNVSVCGMRTPALWIYLSSVCSRAYHQNCTSNLHQSVALCNCNVTYGCGPARFSSGGGVAIGYVLPVLRLSKKKYTQRDSTGGSTDLAPQRTGAESDIYVRSAFLFMHMLRMVMTRSFSGAVAMYFRYCG